MTTKTTETRARLELTRGAARLTIRGASRVELRLPRPSGVMPVRIDGGANHVQVSTEEGDTA